MGLRLYNTISGQVEAFMPLRPDRIGFYVCGPTVYAPPHIGNARSSVTFDMLYRLLRLIYGDQHIVHVRNITDIDDKIITSARADGVPIARLTELVTENFHEDMRALNVLAPDHEPRASAYIPQMIDMIAELLARAHAYEAQSHVLFDLESAPAGFYGALTGNEAAKMQAGARIEPAPYKRHPHDFVLWKPSSNDEPGWDSPWGYGRPGWHIECSAMARSLLGRVFDIHGGGIDLSFPHHENEIVQTRCCDGGPMQARYWVHNGHLFQSGSKMSKSAGNICTVRDLLAQGWPGEVIRYALLSGQYRQPLEFSERLLDQSYACCQRFYRVLAQTEGPSSYPALRPENEAGWSVVSALLGNLHFPRALSLAHGMATRANKALSGGAHSYGLALGSVLSLLGLDVANPDAWLRGGGKTAEHVATTTDAEIEEAIAARAVARRRRDFAEADRIRDDLRQRGIELEDGAEGTGWHRPG